MKPVLKYPLLCGAVLAVCHSSNLFAGEAPAKPVPPMGREEAALVTVTASVEAINYTNREVSLKGPRGNVVTFTADERVKRLNEVKVGDFVRADYYISIAAEVRPPTPEEEKNPLTVVEVAGKAPPGRAPAAGAGRQFKVVTTIEAIDMQEKTVTVKGPRGRTLTARVADPSRLARVKVGDHIVLVYTEAVAISLEKVEPPKEKAN